MVRYGDDCVGPCPQGCMGSICPYRNVLYYYCDKCKCETDVLYKYDGQQICADCLTQKIPAAECDECGDETDELYRYEGSILCRDCLLKQFDEVEYEYDN